MPDNCVTSILLHLTTKLMLKCMFLINSKTNAFMEEVSLVTYACRNVSASFDTKSNFYNKLFVDSY